METAVCFCLSLDFASDQGGSDMGEAVWGMRWMMTFSVDKRQAISGGEPKGITVGLPT
ncbi:MAG: hypothetical protein IJ599_02165 [Alphaproteobacteria bacterium]|nr:hypothetical protein [Alphaproteobacteria bacterium]